MTEAPSAYALQQAVATLQRALADEPDAWGVLADPADAEADLMGKLQAVLRGVVEAERLAAAAGTMIDDMKTRQERFKARAETLRGAAFAVLDVLGETRLDLPDITVSMRKNPARVIITDEAAIPDGYFRVTRTLDKSQISKAIASGQDVPGAELSNQLPSLQIRTK